MQGDITRSVETLRSAAPGFSPRVAIILGSGLGVAAEDIEGAVTVSYQELSGFPQPKVKGHAGNITLGRVSGQPVAILRGRVHLYEGGGIEPLKVKIRTLKELGTEILFLTNAAGSMMLEVGPGELVAITDHINFMGTNPLIGANEDAYGPRFVDLENAWDPELRNKLKEAAQAAGVPLHEGVFAAWMGPAFETPAEIRMLRTLGCDTVGMSMVPENIVARHCGLRCVGVSAITNYAVGLTEHRVTHDQNLVEAARAAEKLTPLLKRFLADL